MTFGVAFVVPSDRPLSPVAQAFTDLVAATYGEPRLFQRGQSPQAPE
jgi:hypothetical protein